MIFYYCKVVKYMRNKKTNTLSIIGFIISFFSIIIGTMICLIALSQIKERNEKGRGLAYTGIIINILKIVFIVILFFLLIFIPGQDETSYKCKASKYCTLNSDNSTYTCVYEKDGVEEYITCKKPEDKNNENYGTEDNEETFDFDRDDLLTE